MRRRRMRRRRRRRRRRIPTDLLAAPSPYLQQNHLLRGRVVCFWQTKELAVEKARDHSHGQYRLAAGSGRTVAALPGQWVNC